MQNPCFSRSIIGDPSCSPLLAQPAYELLQTRANVLEGATPSRERTLKVYLHDTQGVIDEANKFYWLTRQSVEAMKLRFTFGKTSQGNPFCQLRADHWQGKYYKKGKVQLRDCFDIHLELQCSDGEVRFRLHFETNPYIPKLKDKVSPTEFEEHRKQSEDFAEEVANHKEEYRNKLSSTDWRFTKQYANQRATCGNFKLDRNVGDYCRWVETGTQAIVPLIECAGKEADLWK